MANRAMAAKKIKIARMKRAWADSLRGRGSITPNRDIVKQYANAARGLEDETFVDRLAGAKGPALIERGEALRKQGDLEGWLPDGCTLRFRGPGPTTQYQESWVYSNTRRDCFVVVHFDLYQGIERRSMAYSSKELLLMCWEGDAIRWLYKSDITD